MDEKQISALLSEYDKVESLYADLARKAESLIRELLKSYELPVHSVTSRPKERDSLSDKLRKEDAKYSVLQDVTDLAGVRITTYFAADVDKAAEIVEREFAIDDENSVDKRESFSPFEFGYRSLHYVARINDSRSQNTEYSKLATLKIEIQIRSILQHAWAEIEHDLGYKASVVVPRQVRRRFARISGLLELADNEFDEVRKDLAVYAETVGKKMVENPKKVYIDRVSLSALMAIEGSSIRKLANELIQLRDRNQWMQEAGPDRLDFAARQLLGARIITIFDLEQAAAAYNDLAVGLSYEIFGPGGPMIFESNVPFAVLSLACAFEKGEDVARAVVNLSKAARGDEVGFRRFSLAFQTAKEKLARK